jgi:hypothetical protein
LILHFGYRLEVQRPRASKGSKARKGKIVQCRERKAVCEIIARRVAEKYGAGQRGVGTVFTYGKGLCLRAINIRYDRVEFDGQVEHLTITWVYRVGVDLGRVRAGVVVHRCRVRVCQAVRTSAPRHDRVL